MVEVRFINTAERPTATIRANVKTNEISQAIGQMYGELGQFFYSKGIQMNGPPFVFYHSWSEEGTDMSCGFPTAQPIEAEGRIMPFTLPSVKAAAAMHIGPYTNLVETYTEMGRWIAEQGEEPAGYMWEWYLNEPGKVPDSELMTEIVWPIK